MIKYNYPINYYYIMLFWLYNQGKLICASIFYCILSWQSCVCVLETLYMLWTFTLLKIKTQFKEPVFNQCIRKNNIFTSLTGHSSLSTESDCTACLTGPCCLQGSQVNSNFSVILFGKQHEHDFNVSVYNVIVYNKETMLLGLEVVEFALTCTFCNLLK